MEKIPIVDFENYLNGAQKEQVSKELVEAFKTYGFVYLKNFGISKDRIDEMFNTSKSFFESDLETKLTVKKDHSTFCGYDEVEKEKLSEDRPGDLKESFTIKQTETPWPTCDFLKDFKNSMLDFHSQCLKLAFNLIKSLALGLGLNENELDDKFIDPIAMLRLIHYPPTLKPLLPNQLRCAEHSDYGACTLLFQDKIGGLEIKTKENKWLPVPYISDTIVINISNCMEIFTNGYLMSTPHRVVNPEGDHKNLSRYSTPFFFDPSLDCELKCLEKFKDVNKCSIKFSSKTFKDHIHKLFDQTYPDSGFEFDTTRN